MPQWRFFNVADMSFNAIRENKILENTSDFTVYESKGHFVHNPYTSNRSIYWYYFYYVEIADYAILRLSELFQLLKIAFRKEKTKHKKYTDSDQKPRLVASKLGMHCLGMSYVCDA